MYLYKSYCYISLNDVRSSIASHSSDVNGIINNVSVVSDTTIQIDYLSPGNLIYSQFFVPPICSMPGFDNSFTGVNPDDSMSFAWLCASVIVAAFCVRILRRTIG